MKFNNLKTRIARIFLALTGTLVLGTVGADLVTAAAAPAAAPPVVVTLTADKQVTPSDKEGAAAWEPLLEANSAVQPGTILRFTVTGRSHLSRPLKKFALSQPIPRGTEYVLQSASATPAAQITASIDGGETYAENPTIKVTHPDGSITDEPAPASRYTNLRWTFLTDLPASGIASAQCEVRVH